MHNVLVKYLSKYCLYTYRRPSSTFLNEISKRTCHFLKRKSLIHAKYARHTSVVRNRNRTNKTFLYRTIVYFCLIGYINRALVNGHNCVVYCNIYYLKTLNTFMNTCIHKHSLDNFSRFGNTYLHRPSFCAKLHSLPNQDGDPHWRHNHRISSGRSGKGQGQKHKSSLCTHDGFLYHHLYDRNHDTRYQVFKMSYQRCINKYGLWRMEVQPYFSFYKRTHSQLLQDPFPIHVRTFPKYIKFVFSLYVLNNHGSKLSKKEINVYILKLCF